MTLLASFLDKREVRAAMVLAAVLHSAVLFGLMQYSRTGHTLMTPHARQDAYQPIQVLFVAQPVLPVQDAAPASMPQPVARAPLPLPLQARHAVNAPTQTTMSARTNPEVVPDTRPAAALPAAPAATASAIPPAISPMQNAQPQAPTIQAGKPDYAYSPPPDYPMLLREQGVGGVVWLRVWVDSDGHPGEIKLAKGSGYRLLDDAALHAVRQWRFVPAKQGAQSLASWVEFPIRFTLNG